MDTDTMDLDQKQDTFDFEGKKFNKAIQNMVLKDRYQVREHVKSGSFGMIFNVSDIAHQSYCAS